MPPSSKNKKPEKPASNRIIEIPTHIKDANLVRQRRRQIVDASVKLFIENGFHKTTTRQIARATGFSIGSLYEYVASKEDVLYLVCDAIHAEVEESVAKILAGVTVGREALAQVIREYLMICDRMSDHILLMYQVTQFLPPQWKKKVLENEIRITDIFKDVLRHAASSRDLPELKEDFTVLMAHNISVLGQAWAFRRWFFTRNYSIEEYIEFQTRTIFGIFNRQAD
ncbi:MAG: TetR/AcrR family transcriptional regulator [Thermodesulfobacteriota bacterium]